MKAKDMIQYVTPDPATGCGHVILYCGIPCSQSRHVLAALDSLEEATREHPPVTIIEIGTLHGGFTYVLREHDVSRHAHIHTFDIVSLPQPSLAATSFFLGDCFVDQHDRIASLVSAEGRCFLFCDGGNKAQEVRTFCAFMKPDDVILCHDYVREPSLADSEATGGWPGRGEVKYADIEEALTRYGCVPFVKEEMQRAVWGCFICKPRDPHQP